MIGKNFEDLPELSTTNTTMPKIAHRLNKENLSKFGKFLLELISSLEIEGSSSFHPDFIDKICDDKIFSKEIQDLLEDGSETECNLFLEIIYPHLSKLLDNIFGNFLLQKLILKSLYFDLFRKPKHFKIPCKSVF